LKTLHSAARKELAALKQLSASPASLHIFLTPPPLRPILSSARFQHRLSFMLACGIAYSPAVCFAKAPLPSRTAPLPLWKTLRCSLFRPSSEKKKDDAQNNQKKKEQQSAFTRKKAMPQASTSGKEQRSAFPSG
ncbi:MAG: hypothetical protein KBH61_11815, partial [Parabacteroides sp.]|nr:hypothetical protein [Parabacteroides sp.]